MLWPLRVHTRTHPSTHSCTCSTPLHHPFPYLLPQASLIFSYDRSKNGIENLCFTYMKIQQWCVHKEHSNNNAFLLGRKRRQKWKYEKHPLTDSEPHSYNKSDEDRLIRSQKQHEIILNDMCLKSIGSTGYAGWTRLTKQACQRMICLSSRNDSNDLVCT